jgi:TPR repeat protein
MKQLLISVLALGLFAAAPLAYGAPHISDPAHVAANTDGFLSFHPDLRWRKEGLGRYEDGELGLALLAFKRSSRYADKGAQAMVAEMYWKGEGTPADKSTAYAWMDLAAERGYKDFLTLREYYWNELDAKERERALAVGKKIYAEFGDDVAKPRLESRIRKGARQATGSRTGFKGALTIMVPGAGGWITMDANEYYKDEYWKPDLYFKWQDQLWQEYQRGHVEVGALETVPRPE